MRESTVKTWEDFAQAVEGLRKEEDSNSPLLFRGQENSCWQITTTLDRAKREGMLFKDYYRLIGRIKPEIESFTGNQWSIPDYPEVEKQLSEYDAFSRALTFGRFPAYAYMIYLRHHGFPSPILDWTRSMHVAGYFAFSKARDDADGKMVAIYVFSEARFRLHGNQMTMIHRLGPYVRTHRRHFLQQCDYTLCIAHDGEWRCQQHQAAADDSNSGQGAFWKFNIPSAQRLNVLKLLDEYNLNAFSLVGSEESLMQTMALRELNFREPD